MPDDLVLPFRVPDGKCFVLIGPSCYGPVPTFHRNLPEVMRTLELYWLDQCDRGISVWHRPTPEAPWQPSSFVV